ncbi:YceI family protein [Chitinophaga rhizophila]|uniref:YceI family protein n=1 Tax=Chitinophaga rhizophila TaxID=2866212 RepID=A0ABS7GEP2_9BACT|nr:YceI family protein [Chitinophaga rhizophila]MBW8684988.1 YceI family protein [Chitinophaga rhizophila]
MKTICFIVLSCLLYLQMQAQTYVSRNANVSFYSKTPLEDIKAENKQAFAAVDLGKKSVAFTLLQRNFMFPKQLMQDHYNENYAESEKYPKAQFNGTITGDVPNKPGNYKVQVSGQLTLHGVTQQVQNIPAELEIQEGKLTAKAAFAVKPGDYNIKIPSLVKDKIASQINVQILAVCLPAK